MGWGDRSRSRRRARMTVTRDSLLRWDGEIAICSFSFLFPIFAVVVDFLFSAFTVNIFLKPVHFFIIPFSSSSSSIARFRRRTFQEPNRDRTSKLFRRAELIQTPIIMPAELKSKGEKCSFRSN